MCGITGYIGKNTPIEVLLTGLRSLEYRGYDSSGIALKGEKNIQIIKSIGKIKNLEEKISKENLIDSHIGIAHTRWATHGVVNEINAHPHRVGKVTIVHNGIIENFQELKKDLDLKNVKLQSETDTEIVAALLNENYDNNPVEAIEKTISQIKGSYALGIIFDNEDKLYAVRKSSPLVVGKKEKDFYIASDIMAIIKYTNEYFIPDDNEIIEMSDEIKIYKDTKSIEKKFIKADIEQNQIDKNGYDHYMLKEIMEEPVLLENIIEKYINNESLIPDLSEYKEIHIVACGSAMYAGMIGKYLLEEYANIKVDVDVASEYRYRNVIYNDKTLVILVSQSGETADTIAALEKAKENNIDTLAVVNVKTSTIARLSDKQVFIEAGPEIAVATTKAYMLQAAIMIFLSLKAAKSKNLITDENKILSEFKQVPKLLKNILDKRKDYLNIAKKIYKSENIFFIGRKIDYAMCLEGSLKLKEVSYIHSEAYQAGELKHGTISLINKGMPVFAIVTEDDVREKTISNIKETTSRGAIPYIITTDENYISENDILIPKINKFFQPLLVVPTLQLIAYETAKLRNCDIDKPKNLAKSVTVE